MADITPTQTATVADTSGLSQGVQVDTSALRESNSRRTALFESAVDVGVKTFTEATVEKERDKAEDTSTGFFEEIQAGEDVMKGLSSDMDRLVAKKGQLTTAHFDLLMAAKMNESVNKYPWMEKRIANMYGTVTGRTQAVRDIMDTKDTTQDAIFQKRYSNALTVMNKAGMPIPADPYETINAANAYTTSVMQSEQQRLNGTKGTGLAGWNQDNEGNISRTFGNMSVPFNTALSTGDTKLGELEIASIVDKEKAEMIERYGSEIPKSMMDSHFARIDTRAEQMTQVLNGTLQLDVYKQNAALLEAAAKAALQDNKSLVVMTEAIRMAANNRPLQGFLGRQFNSNPANVDFFGRVISDSYTGNIDRLSSTMINASPSERNRINKYNRLQWGQFLADGSPEARTALVTSTSNTAETMIDDKPYHADSLQSLLATTAKPEYFKAMQENPKGLNPRAIQQIGVQGMDNGLEQVRETLSQEKVRGTGALLQDYVQMVVADDGTMQLRTVNLDGINDIMPDPVRRITAKQSVRDAVDKLNRSAIATANDGNKTHAHGSGHTNYGDSIRFKLDEWGLSHTIPVYDPKAPKPPIEKGRFDNPADVMQPDNTMVTREATPGTSNRFQNPGDNAPQVNTFVTTDSLEGN